jgi:putative ABC transport system permease protein
MLRNYLATALRNLVRNRLYAAMNIVGLAVGFAAALLIALFVRDELSFDRWIPGHEEIYRLRTTFHYGQGAEGRTDWQPVMGADWLKESFPDIGTLARVYPEERGVRRAEVEALDTVVWTDPDFFTVFPLPLLSGDRASALSQPNSVVLSRDQARKYFGREDVLGETLTLDGTEIVTVTAVMENLPSNTHFDFGMLASVVGPDAWRKRGADQVFIYLRLAAGASAAEWEQRFPDHFNRIIPNRPNPAFPAAKMPSDFFEGRLIPVTSLHFSTMLYLGASQTHIPGLLKPAGNRTALHALSIIGLLILLISVASFASLMTARTGQRTTEVGVRKVSGALRLDLLTQFVGESLAYSLLALLLAGLAIAASMPMISAFLGRDLTTGMDVSSVILAGTAVVIVVAALLGGLYPATILASLPPNRVFKGGLIATGREGLHAVLIVGQFAVLIGLIVATLVITRQTSFLVAGTLRFETDQMLFVTAKCTDALRDQMARIPGVRGAACSSGSVLAKKPWGAGGTMPDGRVVGWEEVGVGVGFFELYGFQPVAGRFFRDGSGDEMQERPLSAPVILNEAAVRHFGFASADAAVGQAIPTAYPTAYRNVRIIGVVPDFPLHSVREAVEPMMFYLPQPSSTSTPIRYEQVAVKLDGTRLAEALQGIDEVSAKLAAGRPARRQFFDQHIQALYQDLLREMQAIRIFAGTAVFLAILGLFGLSTLTAEQRTKEIGIRKSMGATRRDILRLILWQFAKPVLWANLIAWPAAYILMQRWLEGFAYHIDLAPWMFLAASGLALVIALATVIGHALLVARSHPVSALRYE